MLKHIISAIDNLLKNVSGIIGIILTNIDGKPVYFNGRFDMKLEELSALVTVAKNCFSEVGKNWEQRPATIVAEYQTIKIYQLNLVDRGQLIVLAKTPGAHSGMSNLEMRNIVHSLANLIKNEIAALQADAAA